MAHENIHIIRNEENPEALDILAESILEIEKSMKSLLTTRINRKTLVKLIQMNCNSNPKPRIDEIDTVLLSLNTLSKAFLVPDKKL
ncbi:hypothetical protein GW846_03265 [Candidatus Gracilibacteria bacterium]|nr:hypothetical protein [Candidatus Gracilibacteria bacterium]